MASSNGHDDHGSHLAHVASLRTLVTVFVALLCLTVITVLAAKVDFGGKAINLGVAMAIATLKATLVVLYFMHLRYDKLFHSVLFVGGLLAAALFIGFTLMDRHQSEPQIIWDPSNPPEIAPAPPPQ